MLRATLRRPLAHESPIAAAAGRSRSSTTASNEPDARISSIAASISTGDVDSAAATNRRMTLSRWAAADDTPGSEPAGGSIATSPMATSPAGDRAGSLGRRPAAVEESAHGEEDLDGSLSYMR